jgi:hypothetical protein
MWDILFRALAHGPYRESVEEVDLPLDRAWLSMDDAVSRRALAWRSESEDAVAAAARVADALN